MWGSFHVCIVLAYLVDALRKLGSNPLSCIRFIILKFLTGALSPLYRSSIFLRLYVHYFHLVRFSVEAAHIVTVETSLTTPARMVPSLHSFDNTFTKQLGVRVSGKISRSPRRLSWPFCCLSSLSRRQTTTEVL